MAKLVTVIGATGIQGGSVARTLLKNGNYKVRAITRNKQGDAAKALVAQGAEVVEANLDDIESLKAAFRGTYAIFAVTNYFEQFPKKSTAEAGEIESRRGINMAKAAAATSTLEHYVWSTLPNSRVVSRGKTCVPYYDSKNVIDNYIKSDPELFKKTTYLWLGVYASNLQYPFYAPVPFPTLGENHYVQIWSVPSNTQWPFLGDATINTGLFVQSILDQPDKTLPGKFVRGVNETITTGDLLSRWASAKGGKATYLQVDKETYYKLWPGWASIMDISNEYFLLAGEKAFSTEEGFLTKDDLGIVGLVDMATTLASGP